MALPLNALLATARRAVSARGHVQLHPAPSRAGQRIDLLQEFGCAAAQGNKADVQLLIQADQARASGELGTED